MQPVYAHRSRRAVTAHLKPHEHDTFTALARRHGLAPASYAQQIIRSHMAENAQIKAEMRLEKEPAC